MAPLLAPPPHWQVHGTFWGRQIAITSRGPDVPSKCRTSLEWLSCVSINIVQPGRPEEPMLLTMAPAGPAKPLTPGKKRPAWGVGRGGHTAGGTRGAIQASSRLTPSPRATSRNRAKSGRGSGCSAKTQKGGWWTELKHHNVCSGSLTPWVCVLRCDHSQCSVITMRIYVRPYSDRDRANGLRGMLLVRVDAQPNIKADKGAKEIYRPCADSCGSHPGGS